MALSIHLHSEMYIPVKAIQMVEKPLQLLCSVWPDHMNVIAYQNRHRRLWLACAKAVSSKSSAKKLVMTGDSGEPTATPSDCW